MKKIMIASVLLAAALVGGWGLYIAQGKFSSALAISIAAAAAIAGLAAWLMWRRISKLTRRLTQKVMNLLGERPDYQIGEIAALSYAVNRLETEHKRAVEKIHKQEESLSATLSTIADGLIMTDDTGVVTLVNSPVEAMLKLSPGKSIGRSLMEVVRDHELVNLWHKCITSRKPQVKLIEMLPRKKVLRVIITPLLANEVTGAVLTLQDVTEIRQLEMLRRDFIANISHELRTPLTSLKTILETLAQGAIDDPMAAQAFLSKAGEEVDRLTGIIQELSQLSQLESQAPPINKQPLNISNLLSKIADRLQPTANRAGLELQVKLPLEIPEVIADGAKIEQVVAELVYNAIKFTPSGGNIVISAQSNDDYVSVSVSDKGIGIAADDLPHVFERFYKVDKARGKVMGGGEGTGLGLAIAKHIVEAHDGKIWAESTVGQGSTFSFTLPRV